MVGVVGSQGRRNTQNCACASSLAFCKNRPTAVVESNILGQVLLQLNKVTAFVMLLWKINTAGMLFLFWSVSVSLKKVHHILLRKSYWWMTIVMIVSTSTRSYLAVLILQMLIGDLVGNRTHELEFAETWPKPGLNSHISVIVEM